MNIYLVLEDCFIPLKVITYYASEEKIKTSEGVVKFESKQRDWENFKKKAFIKSDYKCLPKALKVREELLSLFEEKEDVDGIRAFFVTDGMPKEKTSKFLSNLLTKMQVYDVKALINVDDPRVVIL